MTEKPKKPFDPFEALITGLEGIVDNSARAIEGALDNLDRTLDATFLGTGTITKEQAKRINPLNSPLSMNVAQILSLGLQPTEKHSRYPNNAWVEVLTSDELIDYLDEIVNSIDETGKKAITKDTIDEVNFYIQSFNESIAYLKTIDRVPEKYRVT